MVGSPRNPKSCNHARSNSLPSRSHPLITQVEEHLCRIRSFQATLPSSSAIGRKVNALQELYEYADKSLQLPLAQQALAQARQEKCVDELLDGSLRVLEVCSTAKDALLHTKEVTRELQSILRRRGCGEIGLKSEVQKYMASRKVVKNAIHKALKGMPSKRISSSSLEDDETKTTLISMLKEVESVTLGVFESLLTFFSGSKTKLTGWSLVSKLMHRKRVESGDEEIDENEFSKVDSSLLSLMDDSISNSDKLVQIKEVQAHLENLELCFQDLEEGLQCLFRHLIKTRVSLLNIVNH